MNEPDWQHAEQLVGSVMAQSAALYARHLGVPPSVVHMDAAESYPSTFDVVFAGVS